VDLDPNHLPVPIVVVNRGGSVTVNEAFEHVLGHHDRTLELDNRFEVAPCNGRALTPSEMPWERVLRQSFVEDELWYDRVTATRFRYCVRGRSNGDSGVLALEELTADTSLLHRLRRTPLAFGELTRLRDVLEWLLAHACDLFGARCGALGMATAGELELADVVVDDKSGREPRRSDSRAVRLFLQQIAYGAHPADDELGRSYVGARLEIGTHPIGSICLFDRVDGAPFTADDEHALELFAAHAALAIELCRHLEHAQHRVASMHDELSVAVAHDMRTPISAILLQLDLLLERGAPNEDHVLVPLAALGRLRDASRRVSRMVDDLFDSSRIELRRVALDRRQLSLRDAVGSLVAQLEPTLGDHSIHIVTEPDVPAVMADPLRVDEIVTNLLENAAKYSSPGGPITVRIARAGGGATVSVEDQGAGIAANEIPKLFDRYFQAKRPRTKKSGLGIGLYITKGLVEAHGGRIWVDSCTGQGSRFHVWLPGADGSALEPDLDAPVP
jgi:signal transduction histidine kinase